MKEVHSFLMTLVMLLMFTMPFISHHHHGDAVCVVLEHCAHQQTNLGHHSEPNQRGDNACLRAEQMLRSNTRSPQEQTAVALLAYANLITLELSHRWLFEEVRLYAPQGATALAFTDPPKINALRAPPSSL